MITATAGRIGASEFTVGPDGSNATANATMITTSQLDSTLTVIATASSGIIASGSALATAQGSSQGNIITTATATAGNSAVQAKRGNASAISTATGTSGSAQATSFSGSRGFTNVTANATAAVSGDVLTGSTSTSKALAKTLNNLAFSRSQTFGLQAAAIAKFLPDQAEIQTAIADNINVATAIADKEALALAAFGGAFSDSGTATNSQVFSSSLDFNFDMRTQTNTDLIIGLLDPLAFGDHGFDTLRFGINIEGSQVSDLTFTTLDSVESFFNDNVLNMGLWSDLISADNILDINFTFDLTEAHIGESFNANLILAAGVFAPPSIVPDPRPPSGVPVPPALWLFLSGLTSFLSFSRRR